MGRMLKVAIGVIALIVVIAGLAYFINKVQKNKQTTNTTANVQTVTTVTYDGTKFTPPAISIDNGTTIGFVNNSAKPMQITSDSTGFTSDKILNKGETIDFTFTTNGTFTYKNGQATTQTGTVTVL